MTRRMSLALVEPSPAKDADMLQRALGGDRRAIRALVDALTPVVKARVTRVIFRRFRHQRDLRAGVADMTQDVFLALFAADARALRAWDPARGLSLDNYVGLLAVRHALSQHRGGSRVATREVAVTDDELSAHETSESWPETVADRRMRVDAILSLVEAELTPQGLRLFRLLFTEGHAIESIGDDVGMTVHALYAWRSRLLKTVRRVAADLDGAPRAVTLARRHAGDGAQSQRAVQFWPGNGKQAV